MPPSHRKIALKNTFGGYLVGTTRSPSGFATEPWTSGPLASGLLFHLGYVLLAVSRHRVRYLLTAVEECNLPELRPRLETGCGEPLVFNLNMPDLPFFNSVSKRALEGERLTFDQARCIT